MFIFYDLMHMKRQKAATFEWTSEKEEQLKKLLASGLPQSKCAKKLEVPMSAVKAYVQKLHKEGCLDILPSSEQGTIFFFLSYFLFRYLIGYLLSKAWIYSLGWHKHLHPLCCQLLIHHHSHQYFYLLHLHYHLLVEYQFINSIRMITFFFWFSILLP